MAGCDAMAVNRISFETAVRMVVRGIRISVRIEKVKYTDYETFGNVSCGSYGCSTDYMSVRQDNGRKVRKTRAAASCQDSERLLAERGSNGSTRGACVPNISPNHCAVLEW